MGTTSHLTNWLHTGDHHERNNSYRADFLLSNKEDLNRFVIDEEYHLEVISKILGHQNCEV